MWQRRASAEPGGTPLSAGDAGLFVGLTTWAAGVIAALGYLGVGFLVALENVVPPIPSEVILPLAGFLASEGRFTLWGVVAAATVGSVVGGLVLYGLGAAWGEARLRRVVDAWGRYLFVNQRDLDRSFSWFQEYGRSAVLFGRMVPLVRSLISVPAGLARMPLGQFVAYTALGSGVWNAALVTLGWLLGEHWSVVGEYLQYFEAAVVVVLVSAVVWFVANRAIARSA